LKKKKKKAKPKAEDFDAKLAEVGDEGAEEKAEAGPPTVAKQEGDMELGTGIWQHDEQTPIAYEMLLKRFFKGLHERNPDLIGGIAKSYKIPPPQCLREGNKKTIFANISDIAKRLKRNDEHVTQFLFAELGTTGSTDASKRLVIRGRFTSKQLEK
jgi:translation initiation factor 2 subunit 2